MTIVGYAQKFIENDTMKISITVETRHPTSVVECMNQNNVISQKLDDIFQSYAIPAEDIATTNYSIAPEYKYPYDPVTQTSSQIFVGYVNTNTVEISTKDFQAGAEIIDKCVNAGATRVDNIYFTTTPSIVDTERINIYEAAVANAMKRANKIADAAKVKIVKIMAIFTDQSSYSPPQPYNRSFAKVEAADSSAGAAPIVYGSSNQITGSVTIAFKIEKK